jgi:predicted ester cyclase
MGNPEGRLRGACWHSPPEDAMAATPEFVMRSWFEDVWNKSDESTIDRFLHADCVLHGAPASVGGPAGFRPLYRAFRRAFPDMRVDLPHVMSQGDICVARCLAVGTHRGVLNGIPPTNRTVTMDGFASIRVADGQVIEAWNCFDFLGMYVQLGVQPPLVAGAESTGA